MLNRINLFLIAILVATLTSVKASVIDKIAAIKSDEGTFIQMKTLSDVGVTLTSSGEFRFKKNEYFEWKTIKPIESIFTATPKEYISTIKGGKTSRYPLSEIKMSNGMKALINGDVSALNEVFKLKIADDKIVARPKTRELSEFVDSFEITLDADTKPKRFIMTFTNGDVLDIAITRKTVKAAAKKE